MKRVLSFLLVLTMLCSFGLAFAQEEAPAEEIPAAEEVVAEPAAEEPAEEEVPAEPAEEAAPAEEPAAEEPAEEVPAAEEIPAEEPAAADGAAEESAEEASEEPVGDGTTYSGTCGENVIWSLDTSTGVLTISGEGEMKDYYSSSPAPWHSYYSYINSAVIESGVTSIGNFAFDGCFNLGNVAIPNSVRSIGNYAFWFCNRLASVTIPNSVTSIGSYAFEYCSSLTNMAISSSVTNIGSCAFGMCKSLVAIEVDDSNNNYSSEDGILFNHEKTELICCPGGKKGIYTVPEGVQTISDYAFDDCSNLTNVTISSSVTSIGDYGFCGCSGLKSVKFSSGVQNIGFCAFCGCSSLKSVKIPSSVTNIGNDAFDNCGSLTSVTIPGSVTSISQGMFCGCSSLTSVTIPNSVRSIGIEAFNKCNSLSDVYFIGSLTDRLSITIGNYNSSLNDATWHYTCCTISYNANGGDGVPAAQSKTFGQPLILSSLVPTRTGYTFLGWAESGTATSVKYAAGGSYTADADVTLYAVWKIDTYTVSYDANGGSGAPSAQTKTHDKDLTLRVTKPSRTGYTFLGWSTDSTATTAEYTAGGTYTANSAAMLYAVWKAKTYNIRYSANGGAGAPSAQTKTYGQTLTLSNTVPTRTGYTFLGWSTSSTATSAVYAAGGSYTANAALRLYAVWKLNTYTVSYNANGGSGAPAAQTKTYGRTLTLSSAVPSRTGYTFLGWSASSTATSATYSAGGSYTVDGDVTLYAVWKLNTYTVSYNAYGGSGAPAAQTKTYGQTLTLSSTVPTRTGYTFLGWSADSTATSAVYSAGGRYTANAAVTLYAVWQINTYTVAYDANGGSGAPSSQTKTYGRTLTLSSTVPTRTGYTFQGWAKSSTATTAKYAAGGRYTANAAVTLYAVWQIKTYTVSYDANGGSGAPAAQKKTFGQNLTLRSAKPTRTGYTFLGWSSDSTATTAEYAAGGTYSTDAAITLYAVWQLKTYTVSYSANGGSDAPSSQTKTYGQTLWLRYGEPNRPGYNFLGWATSKTATWCDYYAGSSYTDNASVKLYAVWQKVTYSGTGWTQDDNGRWYYFRNSSMVKSAWVSSGSSWYYMGSDGVMATGLQTISGTKYYFNSSGVMKTGWISYGGDWYYAASSGALATGWKQISGVWYYFSSSGWMYSSQWYGKYYLKSSGAMATGWCQIWGDWYYFNSSGVRQTGWLQSGSTWYYLDPYNNGAMVYGCSMWIDGTYYTFNSSGKWVS